MPAFPDKAEAHILFDDAISERNNSNHPFTGTIEETFRKHCFEVAAASELIASKTAYLNSDKAYVLGLLHDCGRMVDEIATQRHHGVIGYEFMMSKGYADIAKVCLTHNFIIKNRFQGPIAIVDNDRSFGLDYVAKIEYDDYDLLIQLVDSINGCGKMYTIEDRYADISARYQIPYSFWQPTVAAAKGIKARFDELCGDDIYKLLNIA